MSKTRDVHAAAIQRSLLELDRQLDRAVELTALGEREPSNDIYRQYLAGLEDRFRGDFKNIPIDVVTRRFRALNLLALNQRDGGHLDEALATIMEANALAREPLAEYPEFLVRADLEIARICVLRGDPAAAKTYVAEATGIAKQNGDVCMTTQAGFATGLLFSGVGRHREAQNILTSAAARLSAPQGPEQVLLKAELLLQMSHELNIIEAIDEAARTYAEAVDFLIEHGKVALDAGRTTDAFLFLMTANRHADLLPRTEANVAAVADLYITTARLLDIKGYWSRAGELLEKTIELFNATGHFTPVLYMSAQIASGDLLIKQKDYGKAAAVLEKARAACVEHGDLFNLALCLYHQGVGLSKSGSDDKGIALFEESRGIIKSMEPSREVRAALAFNNNQIAFITAKNKEFDHALEFLEDSVELLRDEPHETALAEAYRMQGEIYCERRQSIQSERALKKALAIFERRGASYDTARCYKSLGENCLAAGDLDMADYFFEESIHILEDLNIETDLPMLYSAKARICIMQEDYASAEKYFYKDFEIAKKSGNMHSLAFSYFHIGRVRRLLKRAHSAEDYLKRSLDLFQKVNNQVMAGHVMLELALCTIVRLDFKHALEHCDRAKAVFETSRNPELVARLLQVRGMVLRDSRDQRRRVVAERNFEDAIRILEKSSRVSIELAELHYEFAMFWKDGKDRRRAVEHLTQALELCEKLGLAQKVNTYLNTLQQISPEDGAKLRMGRLVDKAAVEQITKGGSSEGITVERKNLSILFTDIRGFTTISETLSLDQMTSFLNDFYSAVTQAMIKCRGRINKFIGDAVLAIFNIDGDLVDHPVWAVRAAFELVHSVNEINLIRGKRGEIDIQVGVGVNTGEVLIGSFGSMLRQDYTAIGDTVNTASRLQGQAGPGEIIVSHFVYAHIKDLVEAEDMGEKPLKGKGQPIRLWKILKMKE